MYTILYIILFIVTLGIIVNIIRIVNNTEPKIKSEYNELIDIVQSETLTEIIHKASYEIYKGPGITPEKVAYITIDDGPSKYTNHILDILKANDVNATFFMIDENMKHRPKEVNRVIEEGNTVGFHSVSHDIHKMYTSPEVTVGEFNTCNDTLYNITGKTSRIIRLPYGSKPYAPEESYNGLVNNDYLIWDWNLDTQDWKSTKDQILSNILYYGRDKRELVILMHEKEQSMLSLNSIILILKERGYTILPIKDYNQPKNFWEKNLKV